MNKSQLLKKIKANKDEINRLKTENETLQSTAVLKGYARWVYNKNGELQEKAPPMTWWNQHRRTTYVNLSQKAKELPQVRKDGKLIDHPDKLAFWRKPNRSFEEIK